MRKITLLIALILLGITGSYAQASLYGFSVSTERYTPITGGTVIVSATDATNSLDSYVSSQLTLPSEFTFAGVSYTNYYVTSNGQLSFGTTAPSSSSYTTLTSTFGGNAVLAPFSADLSNAVSVPAEIRVDRVDNEFVVQWTNFRRYNRAEVFNFQIRLNLNDKSIKFVYDGNGTYASSTSYQPQVGIKSAVGDYKALTSAWAAPTVISTGATSSSVMTFTGTTGFASGLTYTFTTPAVCTGAPVGGTISGDLVRYACSGTTPAAITVPAANVVTGLSYQWQQSANGTDWADVTTGTGATTLSYTPAAFSGTTVYYRLKTICTATTDVAYTTNNVVIRNTEAPATQASSIAVTPSITSFVTTWTAGNGARRLVYVSTSPIVAPANGNFAAFTASSTFANAGQQLVYDGTGTTVTISGLNCNTTYYVGVFDYNRCGAGPYDVYVNTQSGTNTVAATTTAPVLATLPILNTFTGFTGSNLSTVFPGWYEASITTVGGSVPSSVSPSAGTSNWVASTALGTTTAKVNLYTNTINAWIVSPRVTLTAASRLKFKAALTDYNSAAVDATAMQSTDDKVTVLISTDGCGTVWTPLYTFNAGNTNRLSNTLTDYLVELSAYTGQTVQIAFQATDGPTTDSSDYDFHVGNIVVETVPTCEAPASVTAVKTGFTTATVNWTLLSAEAQAAGYEYYVTTSTTVPADNVTVTGTALSTDLSANISGLTANSTYYFWVRSVCAADNKSPWTISNAVFTGPCTPAPSSVDGSGIVNVAMGTINNSTGAEAGNYGNYSNLSTSADLGTAVNFGITYATGYTYGTKIWVDWNNDADFEDDGELVYTGLSTNANPTTLNGSFIIPANASLVGSHLVRIGGTDNDLGGIPCYTGTYGSYEDYTLNVTMPDAPVITSYTPETACAESVELTITGTSLLNATVKVGETVLTTTSVTDTQIVATVLPGTSGLITVTTVGGVATSAGVVTISTPAAFALSTSAVAICQGNSSNVVTVTQGAADYDTYVWSPAEGVTGNATEGFVFTPTQTTAYTLTVSQSTGACVIMVNVDVTVNAFPPVLTISPESQELCEGNVQTLTALGASTRGTAVFGNGTTAPGTQAYPNPFSAYYGGTKTQILFTAAELQAQGLFIGAPITALSFDFFASSAKALNDFRIKIGGTTASELSALTDSATLTTVYNQTYTPVDGVTGWVPFTLTTPYIWNGGNIIVEITHNAGNSGNGSGTRTNTTTTNGNTVFTAAKDSVTPAGVASFDATTTFSVNTASNLRPNVTFNFGREEDVVWSPVTSLYTDAAATVSYTGVPTRVVYFKAAQAGSVVYTATATNASGCSVSTTTTVNVTSTLAPVAAADQTFCNSATVAQLAATGENIQWYTLATGGQALATTAVLTSGTYYATQTANGCESVSRTAVNVVVNTVSVPQTENVVSCNSYVLPELTSGAYYTEANGQGAVLAAGTVITQSTLLYIYAQSGDCTAQTSFSITINITPAPVATATQSFCQSASIADIDVTGENVSWYADATATTPLTENSTLVNGATYYAAQAINGCESIERTPVTVTVTVVTAPEVADVTVCGSYTLPQLEAGAYYTAPQGGGQLLQAGTVITQSTELYVFVQSGSCSAQSFFVVFVDQAPVITAVSPQVVSTSNDVATIADIAITATGNVVWYASEADFVAGTNALSADAPITANTTYYATQVSGLCSTIVPVTVSEVLGSKGFDLAKFAYYPNPVSNELTISYSSEITVIEVYNLLGQNVLTVQPNAALAKVNMSAFAEGAYVVKVTAGSVSKTVKVIKK